MATINNFSDILYAMEQNPELQEAMRNHVLDEELRQLPAVVRQQGEMLAQALERLDELATTLRDVTEQISSYASVSSRVITATVERQDRIEVDIAELKASQARLETTVQEMRESQARMEARQDRMEGDIAELKAGQERLETRQARMEGDIAELKAGQERLETRQTRMENDVTELKAGQERLEARQDRTEARQERMEERQERTEDRQERMEERQDSLETSLNEFKEETTRRLNRIEGQLGNLNGWRLESDVHKNISSIVPRYLMLEGTYVLKSGNLPQTNELDNILRQARIDGRITRDQALEVRDTDVIVTAEDDDDRKYVIVAEVAHTLDDRDITRAAQRSRTMADAMQIDGIAVAIAPRIAPQQRELAVSEGVTVVQIPDANAAPQRPSDWTALE